MKAFRRLSCLFLLMAVPLAYAAPQAKPDGAIKVYPIAAGTAATVTPATELKRANQPLLVGVKVAPPFVIENHGHYSGLAIDLWQEIAADHGWKYVYQPYDLDGLLQAVSDSKVDVALGAITATAAREQHMDFAHPIISSGLAVAVRGGQTAGWLAVAQALVSPAFLKVIGSLALLLLVVGFLIWLLEHRRNPEQFGGSRSQGIFSGFWWAMVTMTTVGYGDTAPRTVGGRVIGLVWMLSALLIVSFFTASITSALTVGQLSERIRSVADLGGVRIASLPGSTSASWLDRQQFDYVKVRDVDAALAELAAGRVDAVVYDEPLLRWDIRRHYRGQLKVLPLLLERQDYAFALPTGSRLREPIDTSLLQRINAPNWPQRLDNAFGATGP
ncbi:MAG: transporter substrate-binding domain-containing protein [Rhodanobacter sp.]|jgi:ABC-type amino acid transport substrate-binding protein